MEDIDCETIAGEEPSTMVNSRGWFALFTGLNLAFFACYMICKPSWNHALSWTARLSTSVIYLLLACCVGGLGTWLMLPGESRLQFRTLFHGGLRGWIFLPAIALSLQLGSIWAQLLAVLSAAIMAIAMYRSSAVHGQNDLNLQSSRQRLFAAEIRHTPASRLSFALSLLIYAALLSVMAGSMVLATALLAVITFLMVLRFKSGEAKSKERPSRIRLTVRKAQPYFLFGVAFYFIFISLSYAPNPGFALFKLPGLHSGSRQRNQSSDPHGSSTGYRTIVLWPIDKPKKIVAPPPVKGEASYFGVAKPMVIPFFGPYWYFKYPGELPGPNTNSSRGDPLKANVHSTDAYPLLMKANQHLADPIDIACCRELQVVFRNDVSAGALAVGISLTDSHTPSKLSEDLGVKVVASRPVDQALAPGPPTEETLVFRFPKHGPIQRFDDIDVTFLPDPRHLTTGRKVAVERFILIPN